MNTGQVSYYNEGGRRILTARNPKITQGEWYFTVRMYDRPHTGLKKVELLN
jgi:hypothetical protein